MISTLFPGNSSCLWRWTPSLRLFTQDVICFQKWENVHINRWKVNSFFLRFNCLVIFIYSCTARLYYTLQVCVLFLILYIWPAKEKQTNRNTKIPWKHHLSTIYKLWSKVQSGTLSLTFCWVRVWKNYNLHIG